VSNLGENGRLAFIVIRVISKKIKLKGGGIDKCLGGVNMRQAKIYIKKIKKNKNKYTELEGVVVWSLKWGRYLPPLGVV